MSLQLAAQHLASRGRGPDTQLVHMAPGEVAGLHALAKAHGGSLTTNPDTGLPEAGFLSSILPMLVGAGLSFIPGVGPMMAAGIVGGGTTLATGSLKKGLMAGLGAYGGAGLGQGLAASAATTATPAATAAAQTAAEAAAKAVTPVVPTPEMLAAPPPVAPVAPVAPAPYTNNILDLPAPPAPVTAAPSMVPNPTALTPEAAQIGNAYAQEQAAQNAFGKTLAEQPANTSLKSAFSNLQTEAGRNAFMGNAASKGVEAAGVGGGSGLFKYGMAAASPVIAERMKPKEPPKPKQYDPIDYDFSYNRVADPNEGYTGAYTGERTYFNPTFIERPKMAAEGGLMDIYPGTDTATANYADGGGIAPVAQNPYYSMSGQSGDAFKYLMGQMPAPSRAPAPAATATAAYAPVKPAAPSTSNGPIGRLIDRVKSARAQEGTPTYTFDPVTGMFSEPTYVKEPETKAPEPVQEYAANGGLMALAQGGQSHLGDYSDGGRLLRGPGDGVSDSIPASIGDKRPARLADGEFVVPARIVSELGNGSTEAGARKLYAMMDRVQKARGKTVGKDRVAVNSRTDKMLPA